MTVLFAVLDGVVFGSCLSVFPNAVQDILVLGGDNSSNNDTATATTSILLALMLCSMLFHLGKALTAFVNTISLTKSSAVSLLLTALCLILFAFSSSLTWLFMLRLVLGMLSGYLCYFFELDRAHGKSRIAWTLSAGLSALLSSALYPTSSSPSSPSSPSSFLHTHPLCLSFLVIAASVVLFFVLYVFSEKYGYVDDEDEPQCGTASSYINTTTSATLPQVSMI
jgi:hypothetical protein